VRANVKSKLYSGLVLAGISWGAAGAACSGESRRISDGGITEAGPDAPPPDAFCDRTWPTTKGNPAAPPTCEDQAACGGPPNDAGFRRWLQCRPRLGEMQCEYVHITSICEGGEWACPPDAMQDAECRCIGPTPAGMTCTEEGFVPVDGGGAGSPG
jgi:hypothetical protein